MSILYVLIPLALLILGGAVWAFFWAVGSGQFDDLDTPAVRILMDDDKPRNPTLMSDMLPVLAAAFATGLLGSAHCLGMCAGISGLFAAGATVASLRTQLPLAIAYNIGRVTSYALLGTLIAAIGAGFVSVIPAIAGPVRLASGLLIVLIGLQVAFNWRLLSVIETAGAGIWNRIAPQTKRFIPATSMSRAAILGLFWGWLPCGLVYSALLLAATTASPSGGGLVMIAFGLGTVPAMVLSGLSASRLSAFMSRNRLGAGLLIVILGIATAAMPALGVFGGAGTNSTSITTQLPSECSRCSSQPSAFSA